MVYDLISLSPLQALATDAGATFATQFAYVLMKLSQISKENIQEDAEGSISSSGFCTGLWALAFCIVTVSCTIHASKFIFGCNTFREVVLPFADMVLFSCNSATGIISSTLMAICFLGEKFDCKYHTSALILIIVGNTLTVL